MGWVSPWARVEGGSEGGKWVSLGIFVFWAAAPKVLMEAGGGRCESR